MSRTGARVSAVVLSHNYGHFLGEALASLRAQTRPPDETIVVNDGSTDDTSEVARGYGAILIEQPQLGKSTAANVGISAASGDYYLRLDADDFLAPTYVEKCLARLEQDSTKAFAYTRGATFGIESKLLWSREYSARHLRQGSFVSSMALVRRAAFLETPGHDPSLDWGEDWDLWLSMAERGFHGTLVPEFLFCYRRHTASARSQQDERRKRAVERLIRARHSRSVPLALRLQETTEALLYRIGAPVSRGLNSLAPRTYPRLRRLLPIGTPPPQDYQDGPDPDTLVQAARNAFASLVIANGGTVSAQHRAQVLVCG